MDLDDEQLNSWDPLRSLFQEAGRREAPQGLESQVMARILAPSAAVEPASPLIGKRTWWAIAGIIAVLVTLATTLSTFSTGHTSIRGGNMLFSVIQQATTMLSSPWSFAVLLGLGGIMALDHWAENEFRPGVHH